jgi:expansin (peptidoglycan-binding protein)
MTMAIAEPFYGSTFGGDPGEACGQCWEITTAHATRIVVVDNLCPIQGNPLCSDPDQTHFDLSQEASAVLEGGFNDMAVARPVPCPVTGTIHIQITDINQWGYFQVAFMNHRIPVRNVQVRRANQAEWMQMERVWGAVWAISDGEAFGTPGGVGGVLRITSAQGQVVTSTVVVPASTALGDAWDLGVQFQDGSPDPGGACASVPM